MTLPTPFNSHHTAWVRCNAPACRPRAVRYGVDGSRLVCFGDRELADVSHGTQVRVAVHEIAGGPLLAELTATLRDASPDEVGPDAIQVLLEHVPLGRNSHEIELATAHHGARRVVVLQP